jgi:hypothetical protein
MFDVHFLVNPSYETTPIWHGFLMVKLAALVAGLNREPQNIEYRTAEL